MICMIRSANSSDLFAVHELLSSASEDDDSLLNRSIADVHRHLDSFLVAELDGKLIGCVAIHAYRRDLCEVRSHVVDKRFRGGGWGAKLMAEAVRQAGARFPRVWVDVKTPSYFTQTFGFRPVPRTRVPSSILLLKVRWVLAQHRSRWLPSLTGRFTLLELPR